MTSLIQQTRDWFEGGAPPSDFSDLHKAQHRWDYVAEFGFVVLDQGLIRTLARYSPILEIGAGSGALANRIAEIPSTRVEAVDSYSGEYGFEFGRLFPVERKSAYAAIWPVRPPTTVLVAWPCYSKAWSEQILERAQPGQVVIYIGEGQGGCTGTDRFHELLESEFTLLETFAIMQWYGLRDHGYVYKKGEKDDSTDS